MRPKEKNVAPKTELNIPPPPERELRKFTMNSALLQKYYPKIGSKREPVKRSITLANRGTNKNPNLKSAVLAGKKEDVQETNMNELDLSQLIDDLELDKSTDKDEAEDDEKQISVDADLIE